MNIKQIIILLALIAFSCTIVRNDYGIVTNFNSTGDDGICTYTINFTPANRGNGDTKIMYVNWKCGEYAVGDTIKLR